MTDPVRPLVVIGGVEALASAALTVVVAVGALGSDLDPWIAVATVVMWVVITLLLGLIWLGLYRRRRLARTPFLLAQAFAVVVAWPLVSSDIVLERVVGMALALMAVAGIALGLRTPVRAALA